MWNGFTRFEFRRYLAIVAALTSEADYVFFPEYPPPLDWPEKLCHKLSQALTLEIGFTWWEREKNRMLEMCTEASNWNVDWRWWWMLLVWSCLSPRSYLALVASLACEADFCFIPEWPPEIGWPDVLCKKLTQARQIMSFSATSAKNWTDSITFTLKIRSECASKLNWF